MNNQSIPLLYRNAKLLLICAAAPLLFGACGGGGEPEAKKAAATPEPFTGQIHEVKMRGTAEGYFFEPKTLTIKLGDKVRFVMVDGGPHNASFAGQKTPAKAQVILEKEGVLVGVMLQVPGQTTDVTFVKSLPPGTYNYICDPHATLGMTGKIIVSL